MCTTTDGHVHFASRRASAREECSPDTAEGGRMLSEGHELTEHRRHGEGASARSCTTGCPSRTRPSPAQDRLISDQSSPLRSLAATVPCRPYPGLSTGIRRSRSAHITRGQRSNPRHQTASALSSGSPNRHTYSEIHRCPHCPVLPDRNNGSVGVDSAKADLHSSMMTASKQPSLP